MTFEEFLNSPGQPAKQRGSVFIDMLYAAKRGHLANALMFHKHDPWNQPSVHPDALGFVQRMWDWPA